MLEFHSSIKLTITYMQTQMFVCHYMRELVTPHFDERRRSCACSARR